MDNDWKMAETIIKAYIDKYPKTWKSFMLDQAKDRHAMIDEKYGRSQLTLSNDNYNNRRICSFPVDEKGNDMLTVLLKFYPDLIRNKRRLNDFLRRFPVFSLIEKI